MHNDELYYDTNEAVKFISERTGIDSGIVARVLDEYSCAMKSYFRKFGNQSSGTRKSSILCLITYPFLLGYWSRPCRICGA